MDRTTIGRDTRVCMSLSARPGNAGSRLHNWLYDRYGLDYLYKSFTTTDLPAAVGASARWAFAAARSRCRSRKR
jgi:shikimate dehydrogenase